MIDKFMSQLTPSPPKYLDSSGRISRLDLGTPKSEEILVKNSHACYLLSFLLIGEFQAQKYLVPIHPNGSTTTIFYHFYFSVFS